jgi:Flp pilus assembly pilin Flp
MLQAYVFAASRLTHLQARLAGLRDDESGAAMIEYALVVGLAAVAAIAAMGTLKTGITGLATSVNGKLALP